MTAAAGESSIAESERASRDWEQLRLRSIVEQLADGIVIVGGNGLIRFANPAAEELFARTAHRLIGTEFGFPIASEARTEIDLVRPGGDSVCAELRVVDVTWDGEPAHLVSLRDVTDRKRAAEHARQIENERTARAKAEAANEAKSEFLATMSHELRTPLNAILGYSDLLDLGVTGQLSPEQRHQVSRIRAGGQHLLGLVNEILDLARIESGRLTVDIGAAAAIASANAALALVQPLAESRGIQIDSECHGPSELQFEADEDRARQILVNLLSNAVKFTRPGGSVSLECGRAAAGAPAGRLGGAGPWVYFRVTDSGVGIPANQIERIFEPFTQVETGRTRPNGGSGLGLTISRRLARLMRGDITVASVVGNGSVFTLWLPAIEGAPVSPVEPPSHRPVTIATQRELATLGSILLGQLRSVMEAFVSELRRKHDVIEARSLTSSQLADHIACYVADLACMLIALEDAAGQPSSILADATDLHRVIAERHGAQRARFGWSQANLRLEYTLLAQLLEQTLRVQADGVPVAALDEGLGVLSRFLEQAEHISLRALLKSGGGAK